MGDVCRTRWVERIEGLDTFTELFVPLYYTLEAMKTNSVGEYNLSLSSDASSHLTRILKFEFVAALVITRHILDATLDVTKLLQGKTIDIMDGIHLINSLKDNIILSIVPSKMLSLTRDGIDWIEEFKTVATFYYDDLSNPLALDAELSLWDTYWTTFEGPGLPF